ncbi:MAG: hypothetical protein AAF721_10655 [Myxococcota bacterium]
MTSSSTDPSELRGRALSRIARQLVIVIASTGAACFVGVLVLWQSYWGYVFTPPAVDGMLHDVATVRSVAAVEAELGADTFRVTELDIADARRRNRHRTDEGLHARVVVALDDRGLLPETTPDRATLRRLHAAYAATPRVQPPEDGYDGRRFVYGVAVHYEDHEGRPRALLGIAGSAVSNDHHVYQELDLRESAEGFMVERRQWFYFDLAGMEDIPLFVAWGLLMVIALVGIAVLVAFWEVGAVVIRNIRR